MIELKVVRRRVAFSLDKVDSLSTQRSPNSDLGEPLHPIAVSVPGERVSRWHGDGGERGGSNSEGEEKRSGYAEVMRTNSPGRSRTGAGACVRAQGWICSFLLFVPGTGRSINDHSRCNNVQRFLLGGNRVQIVGIGKALQEISNRRTAGREQQFVE